MDEYAKLTFEEFKSLCEEELKRKAAAKYGGTPDDYVITVHPHNDEIMRAYKSKYPHMFKRGDDDKHLRV